MSNIEIRQPTIPDGLLSSLDKWHGRYTDPKCLYQSVWTDVAAFVGVFGDGSNGCYEWFIWEAGKLRTSDSGYGSDCAALRDGLNEYEGGAR